MGSGISYKNLLVILYLVLLASFIFKSTEASSQAAFQATGVADTTSRSALKLRDVSGNPWESKQKAPLFLDNPSNIKSKVIYDPDKNEYIIYQKVGAFDYRTPVHMNPEEFRKYEYSRAMRDYWQSRISGDESGFRSNLIPQIEIGGAAFDKIFGSNTINIIPQGSAELIFGVNISRTENPILSEKLRTIPTFDFKEKIQMNVTGTIGDKMQLGVNYNTDAMFEFENRTKLQYAGKEDEILKKVEAGDVTLPLTGTLITGSYSLFGLKTEMQFGKMTVTTVLSQQKGESSVIEVKGGAQLSDFEIYADEYEANRHFFLSQYFRDNYDNSLKNLPVVSSGINIERIEVWVTNKTSRFEEASNRNIVAFMDLAENSKHIFNKVPAFQAIPGAMIYPDNSANRMYDQMTNAFGLVRNVDQITNVFEPLYPAFQIGRDFEKIENARKLNEREFYFNRQLGYISLNTALNTDEVLAVAYEYTLNGNVYKVGEFSTDGITAPQTLILKLIKGTTLSPKLPTWNLMMKNIYSLGSGKLERKDFVLNILYQDDKTGNSINYLPEGKLGKEILLQVMGLDNLNSQLDRDPDGFFDFIDDVTVMVDRGKIIFPVIEPFGSYLKKKIVDPALVSKYVFQELYDSTQTVARQMAEKNKFKLSGRYSSESGSEIRLNATSIPQGAVKVTAGGVPLTENIDYTVDYNMGTVRIINSALIESQTPIQVSLESNQFFGFQTKTLVGTHLDYRISDNFDIGGTILHLTERPYTQKVNFGEEPISNTIWGLNTSYKTQSQLLTKAIDKIPFLNTKTPSTISLFGEFAHLIPGHSRAISNSGNSYIDDFEASEIPLDLKSFNAWTISSIPQGQELLFPEARFNNNLVSGFNRAKLAWYVIDPLFLRNGSSTPDYIKQHPEEQSSHFVREVYENEIFPYRESPSGIPTNITVLNLAYYPEEKGSYNYDTDPGPYSKGMSTDAKLNDPQSRWGGIMREVLTSDFETANIQYIKFWIMDPFVENPDHTGGDLYINLGNISEDILRDSRKSFENGFPGSSVVKNVDSTAWGRVPTIQAVVHAFDNAPESRFYQDVGLDGLVDQDEQTFFAGYLQKSMLITTNEAYQQIITDPSNDDFHYFRGSDYDNQQLGILDRYKKYNGQEGNSQTSQMSGESYPTTGSTLPDMEDINRDNTLSETESYYQYKISMRPENLKVGSNFIVDEIEYEATMATGKSKVKWYQFKIPITDYQKVVGPIKDFKSIRFMRMFLRDFKEPVIMRFARLDLVRAEWRKYNISFMEGGERVNIPESTDGTFEISSVSIEENSGKVPVNYVLPPGFDRVTDPQNPQLRQLNEQSMVLRVQNLEDGDARAAFRNVNLDIRQYRKLRMEVHAEAMIGHTLQDNELTAFIRIGSDYKGNFYEYEIPLKLTQPRHYENKSDGDRAIVWPVENSFDIDLSVLQEAKQERNREMQKPGSSLSVSDVFVYQQGGRRISVSGNPNLSNVRVIMIGVRNPIKTRNPVNDDGNPKYGEVWVNELRLSDFIENGGWAANAHLQTRLADLGTIDIVGQTSTPGWGSIEKKVNDRSKEQIMKYDLSSSIELGKFFPEKAGVRLPVYVGYSETRIKPQYNPLDPDVLLKDALDAAKNKSVKDSILAISEDYARRKTITVSNAGITKRGEKSHAWDLANLSVNYTYNEIYSSNTNTEIDLEKNYRGGLNYDFEAQPANIMPFKKVGFLNSPALRIIKDFNFYAFPKSLSFRTDLNRNYNELKTRNLNNPYLLVTPSFKKDFEWSRIYDFKYDITRQLKFDFTATNLARIDEPFGGVDKKRYSSEYDYWRDSVLVNLRNFGRTTTYNHFVNVTYSIPVNKLPLLSWINANARYGADYTWLAGPLFPDSMNINLGNSIKNHNELTFTAMGNLATLYSKSKFFKNIENNTRPEAAQRMKTELKTVTYSKENVSFRPNIPRAIIHNLKTRDVKVKIISKSGAEVKGKMDIINDNRINFTTLEQIDGAQVVVEGKIQKNRNPLIVTGEYLIRALLGVRSVSLTYTSAQGQFLPGYMPGTKYLGMSETNNTLAPGWPFILGYSDKNFFEKAVTNDWLSKDTLLNTPASYNNKIDLSIRSMVEPFPGMRIDVSADRRFLENVSSYYVADYNGNFPDSTRNRIVSGNFSISVISWGTAFEKISKDNDYVSPTFEAFKNNTVIISERRAAARGKIDPGYNPDIDPLTGDLIEGPYKSGYGSTSREVLIPAFIAAYTKSNPRRVGLEPFPSALRMMPNWRINFDGLSKFPFIQRTFRSVNISHQYRSTYQVGSYTTNLGYTVDGGGVNNIRDMQNNYIQQYEINVVTLNEQFSPLINIDLNWKNSLSTRIEWKKSRTVSLNLTSNQIADARINEIILGAGYRFDNVQIIIKTGGGQRALKSDLNIRLDLSVRDNKTLARKIVENVNQPVVGQKVFTVGATADYVLSDRFNLQVFADHSMNDPFVANTFPTSNTNFGFSLRFTLVQ